MPDQDRAVTVRDNPETNRYEITVDGAGAGFAAYRLERDPSGGERVVFFHTVVDDAYEGQGVGSALVRSALDDVRRRDRRIVAQCPFVAAYIERHAEYGDLVAAT